MPVRTLRLDASGWREPRDFWAALLPLLGAPDWLGPSLDGLFDTLVADHNRVKPPYRLVVTGAPPALAPYLARVRRVFDDARREGVAVSFESD